MATVSSVIIIETSGLILEPPLTILYIFYKAIHIYATKIFPQQI
jgi:hypothetical protein